MREETGSPAPPRLPTGCCQGSPAREPACSPPAAGAKPAGWGLRGAVWALCSERGFIPLRKGVT